MVQKIGLVMFSIKEAGDFVRVSPQTIAKAIKAGQLKSVKLGGRRLVTDQQIHEWLMANEGK